MPEIIISPKADDDLTNIYIYTLDTWGEAQAEKYLTNLENRFNKLAENPDIGKRRPELLSLVLTYHESHHIIVYRTLTNGIEIVRILHERMDLIRHLK